jgi:hypothetical protein
MGVISLLPLFIPFLYCLSFLYGFIELFSLAAGFSGVWHLMLLVVIS